MKNTELGFGVETLECRKMMAADVDFRGDSLRINSDDAGDIVRVVGTGVAGQVEVYTNDNLVGQFSGVESIKADMRGGDDELYISAIDISGDLRVKMGAGADEFDLDTTVWSGSNGVDGDVRIRGDVRVDMGGNAGDYVDWDVANDHGIYVGDDLSIKGAADVDLNGDGTTFNRESDDINVGDSLKIRMGASGDASGDGFEIDLDDVNVSGRTSIRGSSRVDRIDLTDNRFEGRVSMRLGGGNDRLDMSGAGEGNFFGNDVKFDGDSGIDEILRNAENVFADDLDEDDFEVVV